VCFGYAFERSRGIVVPIAMHITFNALNVVLAVWV
jgi:membrane protease YdiL (CAAX protease family)